MSQEEGVGEECRCPECAALCKGNPGWFMPGEVARAAEFLKMTTQEFAKKYLIVEFWTNGSEPSDLVLSPRRDFQEGQTLATYRDAMMDGSCNLLTDTGCILPLDRRPTECRTVFGCRSRRKGTVPRDQIRQAWSSNQKELEELFPQKKAG